MTTRIIVVPILWLFVAFCINAQPSVDDWLPIIGGGRTEVKEPQGVKITGKIIEANTAQDAVNVAVKENKKELKESSSTVTVRPFFP